MPPPTSREGSSSEADLLALFGMALTQVNHESAETWSRFNYLVTANIALLGALFLAHGEQGPTAAEGRWLLLGITGFGIYFSAYTFLTLQGLWKWQRHWLLKARDVEALLPHDWVRLLDPFEVEKSNRTLSLLNPGETLKPPSFFHGRTQPFAAAFFVLWAALGVYSVWLNLPHPICGPLLSSTAG